jgi:hypothetical protein
VPAWRGPGARESVSAGLTHGDVPMGVIAEQLGHADTWMIEKHCAEPRRRHDPRGRITQRHYQMEHAT